MSTHPHEPDDHDGPRCCFQFKKEPSMAQMGRVIKLVGDALGVKLRPNAMEYIDDGDNWVCLTLPPVLAPRVKALADVINALKAEGVVA